MCTQTVHDITADFLPAYISCQRMYHYLLIYYHQNTSRIQFIRLTKLIIVNLLRFIFSITHCNIKYMNDKER